PKNLFEKCYDCIEDNNVIAEELAGFRDKYNTLILKNSYLNWLTDIFQWSCLMGIAIQLLLAICIKNNDIAIV
ncbi:hypothetical protein L345_03368, partial [Ophiophagus hannah]